MTRPALDIILKNGLLPETQAYVVASGVQNRRCVDQFIRGLKTLRLWDSFIAARPLCDSQNVGVGLSAFGLKGAANKTLQNGAAGISCAQASSQNLTTPGTSALRLTSQVTLMLVFNTVTPSNFAGFAGAFTKTQGGAAYTHNYQFNTVDSSRNITFVAGDGVSTASSLNANISPDTSKHCLIGSCQAGRNTFLKLDTAIALSTTNSMTQLGTATDPLNFGRSGTTGTYFTNAEYSFGAVFSNAATSSQIDALCALYKSTLGDALNLP